MASSQNGRLVLEQYGGPLVSTFIPGTRSWFAGGILKGDTNTIAMYVGHRWNTEIEPVVMPGLWGYNYRAIRGQSSGFSNHASGTAGDVNAPAHPLGTRTLTAAQRVKLGRIHNDLRGAVRFGAFYDGRVDEMHWELDAPDADVSRVAGLIRTGQLPNVPAELLDAPIQPAPAPTPDPEPTPEPKDGFDMATLEDLRAAIDAPAVDNSIIGNGPWSGLRTSDVLSAIYSRLVADSKQRPVAFFEHPVSHGMGEVNVIDKTWTGFESNDLYSQRRDDLTRAGIEVIDFDVTDPATHGWTQV